VSGGAPADGVGGWFQIARIDLTFDAGAMQSVRIRNQPKTRCNGSAMP